MHHVHHSYLPQHRDKNMAAVTSLWDRAFGTLYVPVKDEFTPWGLGPGEQDNCRNFRQNLMAPFRDWGRLLGGGRNGRAVVAPPVNPPREESAGSRRSDRS
jgi:hypothetical protein